MKVLISYDGAQVLGWLQTCVAAWHTTGCWSEVSWPKVLTGVVVDRVGCSHVWYLLVSTWKFACRANWTNETKNWKCCQTL